ncbi:DedA family protein [Streptomyces sp. TRM64462]|uniref:DedA family protein n=1 Tax=Streptomyces sp. TRM64462 TaxID=2741726 RepID=UPI0015868324|nr:DedA family protein [Streptomyces sp. TRM64462]
MHVQEWLETVPAVSIYILVGVVIGLESLGIPLPGEIVLVSSALLASQHGDINPYVLGACATAGAIIGDSIGYAIGRRGGRPLLTWLGGKFPKHFSEANIAMAERSFEKWGMWAVFFGRFVALLRIFAGPLAGVLRMPYWKFLIANVFGGILWAGGTTAVVYSVGVVAEAWLKRFSWLGLVLAVAVGVTSMLVLKHRAKKATEKSEAERTAAKPAVAETGAAKPAAEPAAASVEAAPRKESVAAAAAAD